MIAYFTGTGNSAAVAEWMADALGDEAEFLPAASGKSRFTEKTDKTKSRDAESKNGCIDGIQGLVTPVYAWGIPPMALSYISNLRLKNKNGYFWVILTCGDETGMAPEMIAKALKRDAGISNVGIFSVIMPNCYVLLPGFDVDPKSLEKEKIAEAPNRLEVIKDKITREERQIDCHIGKFPRLKTGLVYPLFRKWGIFPSKWEVDKKKCLECGMCSKACHVGNITMTKEKGESPSGKTIPVWGNNCTSCLGCYHICPAKAISYGKATKNKGQYYFPARGFKTN